jgi:hypothetical protein
MSTSTANPTPAPAPQLPAVPLAQLVSSARSLFGGLLWGGVLLLILAWWLGLKFADERSQTIPWIIAIAGLAGLALAGWHAFTLWFQKTTPDLKAIGLAAQRRTTALALLAGGLLLVVVAIFLGFMPSPPVAGGWPALRANFGEAVGLFLFALIVLGSGRTLLYPPRDELRTIELEPIRGLFPLIRTALFFIGIALVVLFAILAFYYRVGTTYFPELAGMLLFSMLSLALALWIVSVPHPDPFATRVFVLIFGGMTGLILFIMTLARAIMWREQVFFSGMSVWQSEESWRLWMCVYLQLVALALMFGSLLLARADIRANAILRRVLYGYNTVLQGLFILQGLIIVNIAAGAMWPNTYNWTQTQGLHALAQASKNLLHELKQPMHVFVLMSQGIASQADVRSLLENLQAESSKVEVMYISPDAARDRLDYDELAKKFPKILPAGMSRLRGDQDTGRGLLIVYGPMPKDAKHNVPYAFIPERKVYDEQGGMHGQKPTRTFKGEVEVMKEINYLVHGGEKRKLIFLQGNDEIDISQAQIAKRPEATIEMSLLGAASLVDRLKKDNYEVEGVTFSKEYAEKKKTEKIRYIGDAGTDKKPELPDPKDTYAVVIAGASSPLSSDALAAIERYLDRGGKLLVTLDIVLSKEPKAKDYTLRQSGLEDMLKKYGITSTDEMAISQMIPPTRRVDPFDILTKPPADADNVLAKQFADIPIYFHSSRVIRPAAAGRFKGEAVYATIPWREQLAMIFPATVAVRAPMEWLRPAATFEDLADRGELRKRIEETLPIVVGVSDDGKPRMVVFGDTEFISNYAMRTEDRTNNYSLFVSALEWMSEHGTFIGPQPKVTSTVEMPAGKAQDSTRIHLVPLWLMFLTIVGLGAGIWLVRRR